MRITIDIEDAKPVFSSTGADKGPEVAITARGVEQAAPPAELAARAAAVGALSGGPAPSGPPDGFGAGVPGFQQVAPGAPGTTVTDIAGGGSVDLPAGAAPGAEATTPAIEIEE